MKTMTQASNGAKRVRVWPSNCTCAGPSCRTSSSALNCVKWKKIEKKIMAIKMSVSSELATKL